MPDRTFERWLHAHRYADKTQRLYRGHARAAANKMREMYGLGLAEVDDEQLYEWWAGLTDASRNQGRAAMIAYYRAQGDRAGYPACDLPSLPEPHRMPRPVGQIHYTELVCAARRLGGIHRVVGFLFAMTGARFTEVQRAQWSAVDLDHGWWHVTGKGSGRRGPKGRDVPLRAELGTVLRAWRPHTHDSAWVFPSRRSKYGHLSGPTLRRILDEISAEANQPRIVPHRLRHSVASFLAENPDIEIRAVQELMGHANLATTQLYTKVRPERLRRVVLHLPIGADDDLDPAA